MQQDTPDNSSVEKHCCKSLAFNALGLVQKQIPAFYPSAKRFTALNANINQDTFFENYKPPGHLNWTNQTTR